jgi:phage-related protein
MGKNKNKNKNKNNQNNKNIDSHVKVVTDLTQEQVDKITTFSEEEMPV